MRQHGFTLLEVLVGVVIFGLLVVGLDQGTHFSLRAWQAQTRTIALREDMDAVDRALRRLIETMDPGSAAEIVTIRGSPHSLAFVAELPIGAAGSSARLGDVALGVDAAHRLLLRWTPHLRAVRLGPPPAPREAELLRGIDRVDLAYWNARAGEWRTQWNEPALPALVRIRLAFAAGDRRHWPDIVAAPMRDRDDQQ